MSDDEESRLGDFSARLETDDVDVVRAALDDYQSELNASWPVEDAPWEVTRVRDILNAAKE